MHWTTGNEKEYISLLVSGKYRNSPSANPVSAEKLLDNYIRSAELRKEWGTFGGEKGVNADAVISYAKELRDRMR